MLPSNAPGPPRPPAESEHDLRDELSLLEVMLDSLDDNHGDVNRASEIRSDIRDVKEKLSRHRQVHDYHHRHLPNPAHFPSSASARTAPSPNAGVSNHETMPDRSYNRTPSGSRKRVYTESIHNGPAPTAGPSKSQRPSPRGTQDSSRFPEPIDMSSPIDLTGDDDVFKTMQAKEEDRWHRLRQQEKADADMARSLQNHVSDGSDTSSPGLPSSSGPNAFDRMNHMYHQSAQSSQSRRPETTPAPPSSSGHTFGSPSRISSRHGHGSMGPLPSSSGLDRYKTGSNAASSFTVPSHIRSEHPASSPFSYTNNPVNTSMRHGSTMPGAFIDLSEDDDEQDSRLTSQYAGPSSFTPSSQFISGAMANRAALQRHASLFKNYSTGYRPAPGSYGMPGMPQPMSSMGSRWGPGMGFRPGMMSDGSPNHLLPLPTNQLQNNGGGSGLFDVINRTSSYDWTNGLDGMGNFLPDRVRGYMQDVMEDPRNNEEQIQELLANIRPDMDIPEEDRGDDPKELRYPLYKHQKIALSWMQGMEKDNHKKGGILADDMGLGKTISSLALIVSRQAEAEPGKRVPKAKTTLIIGPLALIKQWEREIAKKVKTPYRLTVEVYHQKKMSFNDLRVNDVVLTTYGTLASELTKREKYIKEQSQTSSHVDDNHLVKLCPLTGPKSLWYRVILDEAQCIKNAKTKTAQAAGELQAEYRWCLSGTPMMNSTLELASLIRFLRIKPYADIKKFKKDFGCLSSANSNRDRSDAMRKLQTVLKAIMLRRTKNSEIDGKPILELPPKVEETVHVVFGDDEEQYYRDLETKSQVQVSKFLKDGTMGKKYQVVLTLLLRLRQACCHPHLHITDLESGGSDEVAEDLMLELAQTLAPDVVKRIKSAEGGFECPICFDACDNPTIMLPCGHDVCTECFGSLSSDSLQRDIQNGLDRENASSVRCPECRGAVDIKKLINYEIFKKVHMPETLPPKGNDDDDDDEDDVDLSTDDDSDPEPYFGFTQNDADKNGNLAGFVVNDTDFSDSKEDKKGKGPLPLEDDSDELEDIGSIAQRVNKTQGKQRRNEGKKKSKAKGKAKADVVKPHMLKQLRHDASKNHQAKKKYMAYLKKVWEPSAKVDKCTELIQDIQETGEKTIVFSQWTLLLDLLELPLRERKISYRRYDGSMSGIARDNAARDFMEERDVKVILVSLKAGNAGLNLTSASQVIIMDPFWNPYIEKQAVDRAHRIGQQKPVKVHRILIQNTVEDRIVALQERKRNLVDSALSEEASKSIGSLGAQELRYLFGLGGLGN